MGVFEKVCSIAEAIAWYIWTCPSFVWFLIISIIFCNQFTQPFPSWWAIAVAWLSVAFNPSPRDFDVHDRYWGQTWIRADFFRLWLLVSIPTMILSVLKLFVLVVETVLLVLHWLVSLFEKPERGPPPCDVEFVSTFDADEVYEGPIREAAQEKLRLEKEAEEKNKWELARKERAEMMAISDFYFPGKFKTAAEKKKMARKLEQHRVKEVAGACKSKAIKALAREMRQKEKNGTLPPQDCK